MTQQMRPNRQPNVGAGWGLGALTGAVGRSGRLAAFFASVVLLLGACNGVGGADPSRPQDHLDQELDERASSEWSPPIPAASSELVAAVSRALHVRERLAGSNSGMLDREARSHGVFARVLRSAYEANEGSAYFHHEGEPGEQIEPLLEVFRRIPAEGLDPEPYAVATIEALIERQGELLDARASALDCQGLEKTQEFLCRTALEADKSLSLDEAARLLRRQGQSDLEPGLVFFLDEHTAHLSRVARELAEVQAQLDTLLLRGFLQFVLDYKLVKRAHPDLVTENPEEAPVRNRSRLLAELHEAQGDFAAHLLSLRPAHPLYERTIKALAYYRELEATDAIKPLTGQRLEQGQKSPAVRKLKERLAIENFYRGTIDDYFCQELREAVEYYQKVRLLLVDGIPGRQVYNSLNIPIDHRVRVLELSLQRWRESEIPPDLDLYARINIPQFEVEFWSGDELIRTHIVIVGNNNHTRAISRGVEGRLNHTRIFSSHMNTIVLNPTWAVPMRIKKYDLDRHLEDNPNYYEDHGFELVELPSGRSFLRQGPGDDNALGRVKFMFPNDYAIFMHDTPHQHLFRHTHRAFSYGCVRTHDPINLAKWLLERQNGMSEAQVVAILRRERERAITLREPIPVFIEYNTVTVDEEGRVGFLDDIYRYDRAYFAGELPFERAEPISPGRLARLREEEENWRADLEARLSDPQAGEDDLVIEKEELDRILEEALGDKVEIKTETPPDGDSPESETDEE